MDAQALHAAAAAGEQSLLGALPPELLLIIARLAFPTARAAARTATTCRAWNELLRELIFPSPVAMLCSTGT